jgi:hypothetical protein
MIVQGVFSTGGDAELFSRALAEVKTKAYEDSETSLDDTQALNALVFKFQNRCENRTRA